MYFMPSPKIQDSLNRLKHHGSGLSPKAYEVWRSLKGYVPDDDIYDCFMGLAYVGDLMDQPTQKTRSPMSDINVATVPPGRDVEFLDNCLYSKEDKLENKLLSDFVPELLVQPAQKIGCQTNVTDFNRQEGVSIKEIIKTLCSYDLEKTAEINSKVIARIHNVDQEENYWWGGLTIYYDPGVNWATNKYMCYLLEELQENYPDLFGQLISQFPKLEN
ncbi:MAG: hypothetical protein ACKPH7_13720 [Planktothrix sp.]|uniref:hypothetical protein n=1 Tax=Planktothrix sp. TaxID=3088171 RepID=UPI0038D3C596